MRLSTFTETGEVIKRQTGRTALTINTESQGLKSLAYNSYYTKTGRLEEPIQRQRKLGLSGKEYSSQIPITEETNRVLRETLDIVEQIETVDDPIEQANLTYEFKDCLDSLWEYRDSREENWGDLLNILQAVLKQVEFEKLSGLQKSSIRKVTKDYLCIPNISDEDIKNAIIELSKAEFDPWCGISGDPQE